MLLGTLAGIGLLFANLVDEARERAHTDDLTGVSNRRGILAALDDAGRTAAATGDPLSLLVLDLDGFKDVNDRDGHAAGDALLRAACDAWRGVLREGDHIGRIGGDEFVVVAPDAGEAGAAVLADRMRAATPGGITVSIGTAALGRGEAPTAALRRADIALYAEKGRTADPPRRRTTD
jgi:diguanylate cyclase (GGDEF)-like protein